MADASYRVQRSRRSLQLVTAVSVPVVLIVPVVGWLVAGAGDVPLLTQARVSWLAATVFDGGLAVSALTIVRLLPAGDPARWFWSAMSVAGALLGSSYVVTLGTTVHGLSRPGLLLGSPVTQVLIGVAATIVVIVMCVYPLRMGTRRERVCLWLDIATVMVGTAAFCWYFTGESALAAGSLRDDLLTIVAGPVVMLVAVFAVARLIIAGRAPFTRPAGLVGAAGAMSGGLAGAFGPLLLADRHASWFLAISISGDALLMLSAGVEQLQIGSNRPTARRERRPFSILPYLAIAATFALLVGALHKRGLEPDTWTVLGGAIVCTGLVVARQLASFGENRRLLRELDVTVVELRATLNERDILAEQLHQRAFADNLTGLGNRALFNEVLSQALTRVRRHNTDLAVLLLDLDDFKPVNDTHGHAAGDAVLMEVGVRLRACVRESDLVARLGGDEFGIVLEALVPDSLPDVVDRITEAVGKPYIVNGQQTSVGVSIGVTYDRSGERDAEQLLRDADLAMYSAKKRSKTRLVPSGRP